MNFSALSQLLQASKQIGQLAGFIAIFRMHDKLSTITDDLKALYGKLPI